MPDSLPAGSLGRDNGLGGGTMVPVPSGVVGLFGTVHENTSVMTTRL